MEQMINKFWVELDTHFVYLPAPFYPKEYAQKEEHKKRRSHPQYYEM